MDNESSEQIAPEATPRLWLKQEARTEIDTLKRRVDTLEKALVVSAIPYEALLLDAESRKWIAPEVWNAIEQAVTAIRATLQGEQP